MINPDEITSQNNLQKGLNIKPEVLPTKFTEAPKIEVEPIKTDKFDPYTQEYLKNQEGLLQQKTQADVDTARTKLEMDAATLGSKATVERQLAADIRSDIDANQKKKDEYPRPEFHPTKENLASMGALFSLVSTLGMLVGASGKMGANNAMNAMTGMLKGWQTGRKDLYEKEVKEFDKEYKRITDLRNEIEKQLEKTIQLRGIDKEASYAALQQAIMLAGSTSVLGNILNTGDINKGLELLKSGLTVDFKVKEFQQKAEKALQDRIDRNKPNNEFLIKPDGSVTVIDKNTLAMRVFPADSEFAQRIVNTQKLGAKDSKGGAANARYAFNINESFAQAATDVLNIAQMPKDTVLGTFAGLTGQSGDTLISSLRNTITRKALTKDDERLMQQVVSGLEFNMSRALGGGYASSGAKYMIDIYKQQVPKQGDSPIATAMFLARIKQELGVLAKSFNGHPGATPEYVQQMADYMKEMDNAIPFNVSNVINAARKGKATISDQASKIAGAPSNMSLPMDRSQENVQNSMSNASSQKHTLNGREIILKDNKWVFKDNGKDVE
jgi:hypothetical protein